MIGWRILCGGLVFVAVATIAAAGLSTLAGRLEPRGAWIAMALGLSAGIAAARGASAPRQKITTADTILFVVFGLAALRAFLWVVYPEGPDLKILSPHNLGDIALHLNLILRWANGGTFWPENPFLAGAVFPYHPGMDFWNAILGVLGLPVIAGLRWVGLLGAAATAAALWRYGRGFALASFLFAGGLGALVLLREGVLDGQQDAAAWKNLFLTMLVTQRGMLFSLPAGFVLLTVWRARLSGSDGPRLSVPAQAALYASMPFFNAPAFVFLSAVLAVSFFAGWRTGRSRDFLSVTLLAVIPATWLVRMVTGNFTAPNALRWAPGWMQGENGWWFWLENFGLFLPLAAVLGILLMRRGAADTATRVFYGVAAATLAFSFLFLFAAWPWDNTKLIVWGYLVLAPLLWDGLIKHWPLGLRIAACSGLFTSGALALAGGLDGRHGYKIAGRAELDDVQFLLRHLPVNARLACAPAYDHPALLLGQPVVMGHDGHLFSQGLDYGPVSEKLDVLMSGREGWRDAARGLQTHYLFWGRKEKERWPDSSLPWVPCAPPLATTPSGVLYLLTPCLLEE